MVDTVSLAAFATQMTNQSTSQQIDTAVLQKGQHIQNQQGQDALQLLQSAVAAPGTVPAGNPASGIDVHA